MGSVATVSIISDIPGLLEFDFGTDFEIYKIAKFGECIKVMHVQSFRLWFCTPKPIYDTLHLKKTNKFLATNIDYFWHHIWWFT